MPIQAFWISRQTHFAVDSRFIAISGQALAVFKQEMQLIRRLLTPALLAAALTLGGCAGQPQAPADEITISLFGTNDVHGQLLPDGDRGGLVAVSAYVNALRAARAADGGAVLVIDAGDMWQGTLESNLVEGAAVVEAYNAIGFDAAAIGNHEFDFGPVGIKAIPEEPGDDARGALKKGAGQANFPLLAANLIDESTGRPVEWDNVRPSVMLDVKGVKVGVVGVMTANALQATIAANTPGLAVAPLAETITREATVLRNRGASIIIVTAHAGSSCQQFDNPLDLSSCYVDGEIMRVAEAIPRGLVNHIFAGHVHRGIAHIVNDISITSAYSNTRAFSRVDLRFDRSNNRVVSRKVFPPHWACLSVSASTGGCVTPEHVGDVVPATYEGQLIEPDSAVVAIAERAADYAAAIKGEELGVHLVAGFEHPPATESPLANLMTEALLDASAADIAMHNVVGGIRNILPAGALTFGAVYEMFPFDNRVVLLEMSGRDLKQVIAVQAHRERRRVGFSGMRVFVSCDDDDMDIVIQRSDGTVIQDDDVLAVAINDYLALGGDDIMTPVIPPGGFTLDYNGPLARDVLVDWFRGREGPLDPEDFVTRDSPKWNVPESLPVSCSL